MREDIDCALPNTHTQLMMNFTHDELYANPFHISSLQVLHYLSHGMVVVFDTDR